MTNDEQQIAALVDAFVAGWNAGNGLQCAVPFAEDADFFAVNGIYAKGRDVIGRGHAEILSTIFKGTQMEWQSIRFAFYVQMLRSRMSHFDSGMAATNRGFPPGRLVV